MNPLALFLVVAGVVLAVLVSPGFGGLLVLLGVAVYLFTSRRQI